MNWLSILVLGATIKVSIVAAVALCAAWFLRGRSAAIRHWVLAIAVVCAVAMPLLQFVVPAWHLRTVADGGGVLATIQDAPVAPTDAAAPHSVTLVKRAARAAGSLWLAGIAVTRLETGDCRHLRESPSYRPPPRLRHLVTIRQPTCSFPGCRRPAIRCDEDHTLPYDEGGRTCECNLAPLCRRHHRAKQARGWQLTQPEPGTMVWITPSGRSYATGPTVYPV